MIVYIRIETWRRSRMAQSGSATTASESEMNVSQNLRQLKKFWVWVKGLGLEVRV